VALACALLIGAALIVYPACVRERVDGLDPKLTPALAAMGLSLVLGCGAGYAALRGKRSGAAFVAYWTGMAGFLLVAVHIGLPIAAQRISMPAAGMGHEISARARKAEHVFSYDLSPPQPAIAFYAGRPVIEIEEASDMRRALRTDGARFLVLQRGRDDGFGRGATLLARRGDLMLYKISRQTPESP
jgi:hypothetical protein